VNLNVDILFLFIMSSLDKLKKLPVEERVRKLKEYSDKKEEEIKEAQQMLEAGKDELQQQQHLAEQIPIPQMAATNDTLTTPEERVLFHVHRQETVLEEQRQPQEEKRQNDALEETVEREPVTQFVPPATVQYAEVIATAATQPIHEFYTEISQITNQAEQRGYLTSQQMARVEYINVIARRKENMGYRPSESAARELHLVRTLRDKLQGIYRKQKDEGDKMQPYSFDYDPEQYVSK
jgi:hypothetical protein